MFDRIYPFTYIMTRWVTPAQPHIFTKLYRFTSDKKQTYIVEVEEYIGNVFMVKFYLKAHSLSPEKYHFLTNYGAAQTVIYTVIAIMLAIFREGEVDHPSFAFMGSNTKYGDERADEQKANTKRFRSYKRIISIFFGSRTFEFIKDETASILIIKNRSAQIDEQMNTILQHIYNNYEILEVNLMSEDGS